MTGNAWMIGQIHDNVSLFRSRMNFSFFAKASGSSGRRLWRAWVRNLGCLLLILGWSPTWLAAVLMATELGGGHELRVRVDDHGIRHMVFHHPQHHSSPHRGVEYLLWGQGGQSERDHDWVIGSNAVPGCAEKESLELPTVLTFADANPGNDFLISWKAAGSPAPPAVSKAPDPWWTGWAVMLI
jgi:hypothetical protein